MILKMIFCIYALAIYKKIQLNLIQTLLILFGEQYIGSVYFDFENLYIFELGFLIVVFIK